jgi:hypothetical protein
VAGVGHVASGHADPLELRGRLEERTSVQPLRDPHARARKRDHTLLRVDDEERDSDVPGLVIRSPRDDRDVVAGRSPELLERHTPSRVSGRGRLLPARSAATDEEQR